MNTARHVHTTAGLPFAEQDEALLRQDAVAASLERLSSAQKRLDAATLAYGMAVHDRTTTRYDRAQKAEVRRQRTREVEAAEASHRRVCIALAAGEPVITEEVR